MRGYIILEDYKNSENILNTEDLDIVLGNLEIPLPSVKTDYIENQGADGSIDNTEALNEIKYNDRVITIPFTMKSKFCDIEKIKSKIANFIHGKRFKIYFYKDLDYYYVGRISMENFAINRAMGTFNLIATCKPYKYKKSITSISYEIIKSRELLIHNDRKYVVPKITVSEDMEVTFEDITYSVAKGTHEILNIYLKGGINIFNVKGNGTFKIEFQEASL